MNYDKKKKLLKEDYEKYTKDKVYAELILSKMRNGPTGVQEVNYYAEWTTFREKAEDTQANMPY